MQSRMWQIPRIQLLSFSFLLLILLVICFSMQVSSAEESSTPTESKATTDTTKPSPTPIPPRNLNVTDYPWDNGTQLQVDFDLSSSDELIDDKLGRVTYIIGVSQEQGGLYQEQPPYKATPEDFEDGHVSLKLEKLTANDTYYVRLFAEDGKDNRSEPLDSLGVRTTKQLFKGNEFWFGIILLIICGAVITYIVLARSGKDLKVRKIAGLEAVDEAVGRATEMGRSCLFVPGIQDINDIQTVAGITVLSRVSQTAAEYDAKVEVPTSKSLVMTTARETVQASFLSAGRPDAYNEDLIYYVTDEQFGYVAYLSGMMVRDKPAACFYMGSFFAESLILAETGNEIGAIQVAGTAQPAQLPFFVAACDYTLIGEEFFAASAYLSGDPDQLGSLKGQDVGKIIVGALVILGCVLETITQFNPIMKTPLSFLKDVILQ